RALRLFLSESGVPAAAAARIERAMGPEAIDELRADPYSAVEVDGVGFATADALARALGIAEDAPERLDAGILHPLELAELDGHCRLPAEELERRGERMLGAPVGARIGELVASGRLVADGELLADPAMDGLERRLARRVRELTTSGPQLRLQRIERPVTGDFAPSDRPSALVHAL